VVAVSLVSSRFVGSEAWGLIARRIAVAVAAAAFGILAVASAQAMQLAYEPVGLGWSPGEIEHAGGDLSTIIRDAERVAQVGCRRHCERIARIYKSLLVEARAQSKHAGALSWSLTVVQAPDMDAMALPGGQVVISETFIDRYSLSDEALAFVLAHEMSHVILEHERQALTFARMLLPRDVPRSVHDMYVEMDFNLSLLRAVEPVLQQGEFEADELGLLIASAVGYAPERQLEFVEKECAEGAVPRSFVGTHPPPCERLAQLRLRLPLAKRLLPATH
jgi:Zn-dependent protease with chaperone function